MEKEVIEMQKSINCESACVWMLEDDHLYPYIFLGPNSKALEGLELTLDQGLCGYCVKNREEIISNDLEHDQRWFAGADKKTSYHTENIVCLPIILYDECYGCVQLVNKKGGFDDHDIAVCRKIVKYIVEHM